MKKLITVFLALVMVLSLLAGCRGGGNATTEQTESTGQTKPSVSTQPSNQPSEESTEPSQEGSEPLGTADTSSARILSTIWTQYDVNERFASYGGTVEHSVSDAPGDLDMNNTEEITAKYLLPVEQLAMVENGASLVHLMNSNIFTAAAFSMKEGTDVKAAAKALRDNIQKTQWICGQPDWMLIAQVEGHLLMAFGAKENMDTFRQKLSAAFENAGILYDEAVSV